MTLARKVIGRTFGEAEAALEWATRRVDSTREPRGYHIQAYRGHGTAERLYLSGRVLEGVPIPPAREDDAMVRNLWNTIRRLGTGEVPMAHVRARVQDVEEVVRTNENGFFEVSLSVVTHTGSDEIWREVSFDLVDPPPTVGTVHATGRAIVPPPDSRFGIISDIDDTIVRTDVANLLRMMRLVLLTNPHRRLPFDGVADFYRALHRGAAGRSVNPIFYVSSSPWNFYDLLTEVLEIHGIPAGPLFLKDFGLARDLILSRGHAEHKLAVIDRIFGIHPGLPFVLVGDSGQLDPEIYRTVVRHHGSRIRAVYIRDVSSAERSREVRDIAAEVARLGVDMILSDTTAAAAEHAASMGLIDAARPT